jgi:TolB-like protein/Tfp pilus assembly protein PilF
MSDVFVSYKAEDRRRIQPLVQALQAEGLSVWWDEHIGAGDAWRETIERQLDEARTVVVIWSKRSVGPEGSFVREEASRAQRRGVYVPVLIDSVSPPLGFGESQATSLKAWNGNRADPHYRAVLAAIQRICGVKPAQHSQDPHRPYRGSPVSRRTAITGGVAATAVLGAGGWAFFKNSLAGESSDSIAVVPFENLSGDPAQAYFSSGIAEEIRSALARIAGLKVAGSTSSEAVRDDDAETAAKRLSVANILTGSVRQSASVIRITAELIDGRTGLDKWSQSYDRSPGDAIKIQTDIAENVANALRATLGQAARTAITVGSTTNAAAHDLYLKAKAQFRADDSEDSLHKAIGLLDSATTLDPKFADAFAMKANALTNLNGYYTKIGQRFEPGFEQAAAMARQAITLAPSLAAGHMALANITFWQLNIGAAAAEFERGHALAGGDVDALLAYSSFMSTLDRQDDAVRMAREAQSRDPLNPAAFSTEGGAQFSAGRFTQAEAAYRKALALAPNRQLARAILGATLMEMGKYEDALAQFRQLPANYLFRLVGESILYAKQGNRAASDAALKRAQLLNGDSAHYQYADVQAQRGEIEEAFASLDRAWAFRDPGLAIMKRDLWLRPIKADPRYGAFLRRMNFPA